MATEAGTQVWIPVLPSMRDFGPQLIKGAGRVIDKEGKLLGSKFGTALVAGTAAVGAGAAAAGAVLVKTGQTFEDMTNTIQVGTGAVGEDLEGLRKDAMNIGRQIPASFDEIGESVAALNTFTGAAGEDLQDLSVSIMEASRMLGEDGVANSEAFGQAMQQWQIPAEEGPGKIDALFKATQDYGIGLGDITSHLTTYGSVLQNAGFSMDESAALFGQLEASGISVSRVMPGLNKSFRDWSAEGKNSREELERTVEQMKNAETESEALNIATETFGAEGAQRMTTAIRSGSLELDDLSEALAGADGAVAETAESTKTWTDHWNTFKNNVLVWLEPLATNVLEGINSAMETAAEGAAAFVEAFETGEVSEEGGIVGFMSTLGSVSRDVVDFFTEDVIPVFEDLAHWVEENSDTIQTIITVAAGAAAPFVAWRAAILGVTAAKTVAIAVAGGLSTAIRGIGRAIYSIPIVGWIAGIVGALIAFISYTETGQKIWTVAWDWIKTAVADAWESWIKPTLDWIGEALIWLNEEVVQPTLAWMVDTWNWLAETFAMIWEEYLKPVFQTFGSIIMWLYEEVVQPVFQLIGTVFTWLWENIVQPVVGWIIDLIQAWAERTMSIWKNYIQPVFQLIGAIISWVWENIAKPYFTSIKDAFVTMATWLWNTWQDTIWPALRDFGDTIVDLWNDYVSPALDWIADAWDTLSDTLDYVWTEYIKPVFQAVADFVMDDLVGSIEEGVDMIGDAWAAVANFFRTPINWVINTVWNDGIASAFNAVANAVNADVEMGEISEIPEFAKGGYHQGGWAVVGEQGPELAYFGNDARLLTASQTRRAFAERDMPPTDEEVALATGAVPPHRSPVGGNVLSKGWNWLNDNTPVGDVVDWSRGKLADGAETLMEPILDRVSDFVADFGLMGQLGAGIIDWGMEKVLDWIRGHDEAPTGGDWDGEFTANPGGFNRPANGPITSWAGPRNFALGYSSYHHGVDIGAPMGAAVRAAFDGVVKSAGWGPGNLGNTVVLNHGGYDTAYAHLSAMSASPGQEVSGGQRIGSVGASGGPFAPHLHFERHVPGFYSPVDPNPLLRDQGGLLPQGLSLVLNKTGGNEYIANQQQFDDVTEMARRLARGDAGGGDRQLNVYQYGIDYEHADRNALAIRFAERRESRKAGMR